eukprot:6213555-Pleurochrysis_carterae.AAC.1
MISDTETRLERIDFIKTGSSDSRGIETGTPHVAVEHLCLMLSLCALDSSYIKIVSCLESFHQQNFAESGTHASRAWHQVRIAAYQNAHAAQCAPQLRGRAEVHTCRRRAHADRVASLLAGVISLSGLGQARLAVPPSMRSGLGTTPKGLGALRTIAGRI